MHNFPLLTYTIIKGRCFYAGMDYTSDPGVEKSQMILYEPAYSEFFRQI